VKADNPERRLVRTGGLEANQRRDHADGEADPNRTFLAAAHVSLASLLFARRPYKTCASVRQSWDLSVSAGEPAFAKRLVIDNDCGTRRERINRP
jgi:hypothetical protein